MTLLERLKGNKKEASATKEIEKQYQVAKAAVSDKNQAEILARKEFKNLKSKCLTCQNAFVYTYLPNPDNSLIDPTLVKCKVMAGMGFGNGKIGWQGMPNNFDSFECLDDYWFRKVTACSDFKQKENNNESN